MNRGCDERCTCNRGEWICEPRCMGNTFKLVGGAPHMDVTHCQQVAVDECCATMECGLLPTMGASELNAEGGLNGKSVKELLYLTGKENGIFFVFCSNKNTLY